MNLDIKFDPVLDSESEKQWDLFVERHPLGTACHLSGFAKSIQASLGFKALFVSIFRGQECIGVWPFSLTGFFRENRAVSMPLFEEGGPLLNFDVTEAEWETIFQITCAHLREKGIDVMENRCALGLPDFIQKSFTAELVCDYASLKLGDPDKLFQEKLDYQVRKAVNKARRSQLVVEELQKADDVTLRFFPMYLRYMKEHHGSPPLPLTFFQSLTSHFKDKFKFFFVKFEGKDIAALVGFTCGKRVYISHAPAVHDYQNLRSSDLAHWAFIEWACKNNFEYFDFGNARYPGQINFKKKWGCEFKPYYKYFTSLTPKSSFPKTIVPEAPLFQLASWLWKRFVPLSLTEPLGRWVHIFLGD